MNKLNKKYITLVDGNYIKLSINKEVENYLNYDLDFYKNIFSYEVEQIESTNRYVKMDLEDIKDFLIDAVYTFEVERSKADEDLKIIFESVVVGYDEEDYNNLKMEVINIINNYQDLELKELYKEFLEDGESIFVVQYVIDEIIGTCREMGVYSQFIEEFENDEEIKEAILNYVTEIDKANEEHKERKAKDIKMVNEKAESGEDIEELEVISNTIDRYYYDDEDYRAVYHKLQLRIEYLHTVKYIEDLKNEESSKESKIEQVTETMKAMRNSKSIEELSKFIIELMN